MEVGQPPVRRSAERSGNASAITSPRHRTTMLEGKTMLSRVRILLAAAAVAAAVITGAAMPAHSASTGVTVADGVCPGSTNWDNLLHTCR